MSTIFIIKNLQPYKTFRLPVLKYLRMGRVWVAGGSLRTLFDQNVAISDYDLFFSNKENLNNTKEQLVNDGWRLVFACPKGELFTYKRKCNKVQLIAKQFYHDAESLIDTFDFTICQIAFDNQTLTISKEAIKSQRTKKLKIHKITYPVATLKRLFKYKDRGFEITENTLKSIVTEISGNYFSEDSLMLYLD